MKYLLIGLISFSAVAANIHLEPFDQAKLEYLMQRIPGTLDKTETQEKFVRKYSSFLGKAFTIKCEGDHYEGSPISSNVSCTLTVPDEAAMVNGEYALNITDEKVVERLFKGIPEGITTKKMYSLERIGTKFRYVFVCQKDNCKINFGTFKPEET